MAANISLDQTTLIGLVVGSTAIILGSFLVMQILIRVIGGAARRAGARPSLIRTTRDLLIIVWAVLAVSSVASFTGLATLFTTLTISGIAGLAVSLALQSTLSNIISGILMFTDGTVHVGDIVSYGGMKGEVIRLSLRNTWIKTEQGNVAVIGNSTLMAGPVVNISGTERLMKKLD